MKEQLRSTGGTNKQFVDGVDDGSEPFTMVHVEVPQQGVPANGLDDLKPAFEAIRAAWQRGEGAAVHCGGGMTRTGFMLTATIVYLCGWKATEALAHVQDLRFNFSPNES